MGSPAILWTDEPAGKNYVAAYDLLALVWADAVRAEQTVERLKHADVVELPAANVCWAARFAALSLHDPGVQHELRKLAVGKPRHPVLVVRDGAKLLIADGHHRLSVSYLLAPFAPVRLKVA